MSDISVQDLIGKGYGSGWFTNCKARYRVFEGARGTKKSVNIAGYVLEQSPRVTIKINGESI